MSSQVLLIATLALAALLLVALVLLVGHGTWRALAEAYWRRPIADARRALAETADRLELSDAGAKALERLPARRRIDVFVELAHSVAGAPQQAIADAARRLGVIASAERWCSSRRWRRRLRGSRLLATIGGGEEVVPPLLGDPRPEVRAQAAEWAAGHPPALWRVRGLVRHWRGHADWGALEREGFRPATPRARP